MHDGTVTDVALEIFEPPRYFEALLVGRHFTEAPDITARICGICPVAYQMSACAAMEDACGVTVDERVSGLRRLLYCGEWIQSHALHIYLLHAPDFLGCADAVELAELRPGAVERGLQPQAHGQPGHGDRRAAGPSTRSTSASAASTGRPDPGVDRRAGRAAAPGPRRGAGHRGVGGGIRLPRRGGDYRFVALRDRDRYPIERGRPSSSDGLDAEPGRVRRIWSSRSTWPGPPPSTPGSEGATRT